MPIITADSPKIALNEAFELPFYTHEYCLRVLRALYLTRYTDEKMKKLVRQNKGGSFQLSAAGHELIGVLSAFSLKSGKDWGFPYYRDRGFAIGLGSSLIDIFGAFLAREVPHHSGGRMMPDHFSHKDLRIPCQSSCVGSQFLHAVGCAKGISLKKEDEVVYVSGGDGSTSQGDFHEALNFSCLHKLPILFVIQDNGWAISVPVQDQTAGGSFVKIAKGYEGLSVYDVDGCDFLHSSKALHQAVQKARMGDGPSLIVAHVPRIGPHSSSDDPQKYKDEKAVSEDIKRDPILKYEKFLEVSGLISKEEMQACRIQCQEEVEKSASMADTIPFPKKETAHSKVFVDVDVTEELALEEGEPIVIMDALNHAHKEEMESDASVVVFGQDVAHGKGGVFGITRGLTQMFGVNRCFNTPLAESTIIGISIGLAFKGFRPVAEIQFADYSWTGMNQLFNELSSIYYRSNGEWNCPVVIRMPYGGYIQGGPYHSQSIEAFLAHCPGLKVVIPSNASDAKRLLKTAIRDPNPVVFLEHKALYRQRAFCARPEPGAQALLPFGKANVVKEGTDITVIAWGMAVMMAAEVSDTLRKEGFSVEVIDLRTLVPLDMESVLKSVQKTSKVLIVHEAAKNCGFGAELSARIVEECFSYLDAPIQRVAGKDCPVPYCKDLEDEVLPQKKDIEEAIKNLSRY